MSLFNSNRISKFVFIFLLGLLVPLNSHSSSYATNVEQVVAQNSIILMIGDGMGWEQIELGRLVEYGEENLTAFDEFTNTNNITTDNISGGTTDSAASATTIATGVKTSNGRIAMDDSGNELQTILERANLAGYKTGLITTVYMQHATPAAFAAHDLSRNNYVSIAADMANNNVDLLFGGGSSDEHFGTQTQNLIDKGYEFIDDQDQLPSLTTLPVLGLFSSGSLKDESERTETTGSPTLTQMTEKALQLFEDEPFFLMVEGGKIDWGGHDNDPVRIAHEQIEFEKAVGFAKTYAELNSDTLLLVTADHETGGLSIDGHSLTSPLPTSSDDLITRISKRNARISEITTSFSTTGHTKTQVILAGMGPGSEAISEAVHHVDTYEIMLGQLPELPTSSLPSSSSTDDSSDDGSSNNGFIFVNHHVFLIGLFTVTYLLKRRKNKLN